MGLLSRSIFREVANSALLGTVLFTFVLFLQRVGKLFEILVRSSAPPPTVGYLFALADSLHAHFHGSVGRAGGSVDRAEPHVERRRDHRHARGRRAEPQSDRTGADVRARWPHWLQAASSLWLTPYATKTTYKVLNQLVAAELTAEVQPHVFEEQFPNRVLYIQDVIPGALTRWRNVFIADITPPEEQKKSDHDRGDGPRITVAADAIAVPDVKRNRIQLSMQNGLTYEVGKEITEYYTTSGKAADQILEATKPNEVPVKPYTELDTYPLYKIAYHDPKLDRG